jgi:hypothetical protein
MKRTFILTAAVMILAGALAFAKESVLIDFTQLDADTVADENGKPTENSRTVMDYSVAAGATFTDTQKSLMKTSLALRNWEVKLNSSAKTVNAVALSQVLPAKVKETKKGNGDATVDVTVPFKGKSVMGVRVLFPTWNSNANAKIVPPYEIQAYEPLSDADENGNRKQPTDDQKGKYLFEDGYGLVKNVGTLKSIAVTTMGMNFPHGLYVLLKDNDNIERRYFMGYLNFDGWKTLIWNNPQYITEVRTREIRIYPIYPRGTPFVKFSGFQITRDASDAGDDFIGYFKDVKVIYDLAVLTADRDIDDENLWGIITKKEKARQNAEMSRFGNVQVNRYLESEKMATEEDFTASDYMGDTTTQQKDAAAAEK